MPHYANMAVLHNTPLHQNGAVGHALDWPLMHSTTRLRYNGRRNANAAVCAHNSAVLHAVGHAPSVLYTKTCTCIADKRYTYKFMVYCVGLHNLTFMCGVKWPPALRRAGGHSTGYATRVVVGGSQARLCRVW